MSVTRLTKDLRNIICNTLMDRAYVERRNKLEEMEHSLGMDVYNDFYTADIREKMSALPKDFFEESIFMRVSFDNTYYHIYVKESVLFGYNHNKQYVGALNNYPAGHELTDKFILFKKYKEELEHDLECLKMETFAILEKCATVKKLIETWPEITSILQELNISTNQSPKVLLPAVIHDMNNLFQLKDAA